MAYKVEATKEFVRDLEEQIDNLTEYRSEKSATTFHDSVMDSIGLLLENPHMGQKSNDASIRSVKVGFDIRMYYKVIKKLILLLNLFSTRANPDDNPYE